MADRSVVKRVVIPTVAVAVATSAVAIVINYATTWQHNAWAWLAVGVLTLVSAGFSVWQNQQQDGTGAKPEAGWLNKLRIGARVEVRDKVEQVGASRNIGKVGRGAHIGSYRQVAGLPAAETAETKGRASAPADAPVPEGDGEL